MGFPVHDAENSLPKNWRRYIFRGQRLLLQTLYGCSNMFAPNIPAAMNGKHNLAFSVLNCAVFMSLQTLIYVEN